MAALHLLGTGSGLLNPARHASACLLEAGDGDILFDAGEPVAATLARRGYDWARLNAIVLTHAHADHLGGLPMLMQQLHLSRRTNALALVVPAELAAEMRGFLALFYLFPELFSFALQILAVRAGQPLSLGSVELVPIPTAHLEHYREGIGPLGHPNACQAFAYRVTSGGVTWLYSGDLGSFADIEPHLEPCTVAIVDSTHVGLTGMLDWAAAHPTCRLYLSHVSPHFDLAACLALVEQRRLTGVRVATDGERVTLG